MSFYKIKIKDAPCFDGVEKAYIDKSVWDKDYRPLTYAQIIFVPGDGFYVKLTCHEQMPLARYTEFYDPVYTDSCMEFFADFDPDNSKIFINCETNAFGTILCGVGEKRNNRKKITEYGAGYPEVTPCIEEDKWSNVIHITLDQLKAVYGDGLTLGEGSKLKGNIYKCGDDTPVLHHLMWNPVYSDHPDFHRPDFFGDFEIVK